MRAALMSELGGPDTTKKFKLLEMLRTFNIGSPQSKLCWFEKRSLVGVTCDNAGKSSSTSVLATTLWSFFQNRNKSEAVPTALGQSSVHRHSPILSTNSLLLYLDQHTDIYLLQFVP
jgi:hypothetical protein